MRHHSERVPGKNYRELAGHPLYWHVLDTLGRCPSVDRIVVDTDSPTIRQGVQERFPAVQLIERPEHLRAGEVPMNAILRHDVGLVESHFYLQTHSTNPLLRAETVERAVERFVQGFPEHDSLFSVTPRRLRYWSLEGEPINHDPQVLERTQDMRPLNEENSCIYLFERQSFLERGNRIGPHPLLFEMDPLEAWDIDDESDWAVVQYLIEQRRERS